jgi:16S rRNA (guanine527-N7)-methyltransferase
MSASLDGDPALLANRLANLDPAFAPLAPRFAAYLTLLRRWNRVHNLTAIDDYTEMVDKHLLDSLVCLPHLCRPRVLDVGSGAGVPGLVWALADSTLACTLVEPRKKRTAFLRQAVIELHLGNVEVLCCRSEEIPGPGRWDTIASRAFGDFERFWRATRQLHAPGSRLLMLKGRATPAELAFARDRNPAARLVPLQVPGVIAERHVLQVDFV